MEESKSVEAPEKNAKCPEAVSPEGRQTNVWNKRIIEEGDVVFLWRGNKEMPQRLIMTRGEQFHNDFGVFRHDDVIGKKYGTRIYSNQERTQSRGKGRKRTRNTTDYMYVMSFSPEIWTDSLSHRTQILYTTDNSVILGNLHLKPGCRVAESGTGSGSLSHVLARTIGPTGHLDTYEFNEHRVVEARQDFQRHGLSDVVTVHHRDVCTEGFGEHTDGKMDAVFLDLPTPWSAVKFAKKSLKPSGRICSFSPCIEQVQAFCLELEAYGFYQVETYECLLKEYIGNLVCYPTPCCLIESKENDAQSEEVEKEDTNKVTKPKAVIQPFKTGKQSIEIKGTRPLSNIAGHTGYLTFAYRK